MKNVTIYTDGACKGNPGPGGWAALIIWDSDNIEELHGSCKNSTNNQMEMMAIINALRYLEIDTDHGIKYEIDLCSDSKYVLDSIQKGWAKSWKRNNWTKSDGSTAKNSELWEIMLTLIEKFKINYHWVKGHASNKYNNRCDELAVMESNKA